MSDAKHTPGPWEIAAAKVAAGDAAKDAEETWQLERLVLWLTDEPEPLALPEIKEAV